MKKTKFLPEHQEVANLIQTLYGVAVMYTHPADLYLDHQLIVSPYLLSLLRSPWLHERIDGTHEQQLRSRTKEITQLPIVTNFY